MMEGFSMQRLPRLVVPWAIAFYVIAIDKIIEVFAYAELITENVASTHGL